MVRRAVSGIVLLSLLAACSASTPSATPAPTSAPTASAAPTASPTASPSPTPIDVSAPFLKIITATDFSATATYGGTIAFGEIPGTIGGSTTLSGGDSSSVTTIASTALNQSDESVRVGDTAWKRRAPGPWLVDTDTSNGNGLTSVLRAMTSVTDLGVVTKNGRSLHHLQAPGGGAIDPSVLGYGGAGTKNAKFSLDFYATDDGTPAILTISGDWTQVTAEVSLPVVLRFDITFDHVGTPQVVTAPTDVWAVYVSKLGYSMAHPAAWVAKTTKSEDVYSVDGQGYVYVTPQKLPKGMLLAGFTGALKSSYKAQFGDPKSEVPTTLGGQPAERLLYEYTNAKGQDVTVADDAAVRSGIGWEVFIVTAGGQEDVDFFETFLATFAFAD